ncbi:MAG: 16S rRNA (guanine(527)-N(7))-methyltransferase RsmG [Alcanivoracaceae bacterium]|nr:16S rRNA (guanine(527)-N(7))-methyltransferase RsmG [Alcanivoracaceae bacterium]
MSVKTLIADGVAALGLPLSAEQHELLEKYVTLLHRWNKAFNLTAVREPEEMVVRHLLDSLAVSPWIVDGELLDIGTGAGLPGIPLAIAHPGLQVTMLDSNGKKTRFVKQAILELGLPNATVVQSRVEQYRNAFPQVTTRAFAALPDIIALAAERVAPGGRLLALKSALTDLEMAGLQVPWQVERHQLTVPFLDEQRQLLILAREGESK